jgi:hypothetical protein
MPEPHQRSRDGGEACLIPLPGQGVHHVAGARQVPDRHHALAAGRRLPLRCQERQGGALECRQLPVIKVPVWDIFCHGSEPRSFANWYLFTVNRYGSPPSHGWRVAQEVHARNCTPFRGRRPVGSKDLRRPFICGFAADRQAGRARCHARRHALHPRHHEHRSPTRVLRPRRSYLVSEIRCGSRLAAS